MKYPILELHYQLGTSDKVAIVSTRDHGKAVSILEKALDEEVKREPEDPRQLTAQTIGFRIIEIYETDFKTNKEGLISTGLRRSKSN